MHWSSRFFSVVVGIDSTNILIYSSSPCSSRKLKMSGLFLGSSSGLKGGKPTSILIVLCSLSSLNRVSRIMTPGRIVEETATAAGFKPIRNLTGHSLARWNLHAGLTVPNVKEETGQKLSVGDVVALEPFVTDGAGYVKDLEKSYIFRYLYDRPVRLRMARELLRNVKRAYDGLPFAERWLAKKMSKLRLELTLRELVGVGSLWPYHVLAERAGGKVAQAEHTVIVTEQGCEAITR